METGWYMHLLVLVGERELILKSHMRSCRNEQSKAKAMFSSFHKKKTRLESRMHIASNRGGGETCSFF